jgi:hypothetical protein
MRSNAAVRASLLEMEAFCILDANAVCLCSMMEERHGLTRTI